MYIHKTQNNAIIMKTGEIINNEQDGSVVYNVSGLVAIGFLKSRINF